MEQPLKFSDLQIVLLGKNGAGKSATGNTIIDRDRDTFKEDCSPQSVTRICQSAHTEMNGQRINVIDTVGLSDTSNTDIQTKTEEIFQYAWDGIDVFLLVIKLGNRYTEEEQNAVKGIQENLGAKASKYTIVLFTHGDLLPVSMEKYLTKSSLLSSLVGQCSGGYHVFNNRDKDQYQVTELLMKIESLRKINEYSRYTKQDYEKNQKERLNKKCCIWLAIGGAIIAAVIIAKIEAVPSGNAAVITIAVGACLGAAAVYLARKIYFRKKD